MVGAIKVSAKNHNYLQVTFAGTMVIETWCDQLCTYKHTYLVSHNIKGGN
jgi:hypothetical protein